MEDNKANDVANQTEIPVSEAPKLNEATAKKFNIKELPVKYAVIGFVVVVVVIVAIVGVISLRSHSQESAVDSIKAKAEESYNAGDYKEAEKSVSEGLALEKNDPKLLAAQIKILASKGNQTGQEEKTFEEAKPYIDEALKVAPDDVSVLLAAGYAYETKGEYDKAAEFYDKALKIDPKSSEAWFRKGHILYFLGDFAAGKEAYAKSFQLDKTNGQTLIALGNVEFKDGNLDQAYKLYMIAADITTLPNQTRAEALTAASLVRRVQVVNMNEAIELSKKAVDMDPDFSPALAAYGYNLSINGNPAEGFEYIKKAIKANPRISLNYSLGSKVLRAAKMYEDAIKYQKDAIEHVNEDNTLFGDQERQEAKAQYTYDLAVTYSVSGGNPDTLILLQQAIAISPDLKTSLKNLYDNYGAFQELSGNEQFQALLT